MHMVFKSQFHILFKPATILWMYLSILSNWANRSDTRVVWLNRCLHKKLIWTPLEVTYLSSASSFSQPHHNFHNLPYAVTLCISQTYESHWNYSETTDQGKKLKPRWGCERKGVYKRSKVPSDGSQTCPSTTDQAELSVLWCHF